MMFRPVPPALELSSRMKEGSCVWAGGGGAGALSSRKEWYWSTKEGGRAGRGEG